jgi:hypothetical protein
MLDLTNFETTAEEGCVLFLKDPANSNQLVQDDEAKTPVSIRLAGVESPRWTKAADALANKIGANKEDRNLQTVRSDRAHLLAAVTIGWSGIVVDGAPVEFSFEAAKKLYIRFKWIMEQADRFVGDRKVFLPASSIN